MNFPEIKNKVGLVIAWLILIPLAYLVYDRLQLLYVGERVVGVVENIWVSNGDCESGGYRGSRTYSCTRYDAIIGFETKPPTVHRTHILSWWSKNGHNQPISYSSRQVGDATKIIYDPEKASRIYENTIWGIWSIPLIIFFFLLAFVVSALTEDRKDFRRY